MSILDWLLDAANDIIDRQFVLSDLKDMPLTEAEKAELREFDSLASHTAGSQNGDSNIPPGKLVL